MTHSPALKFSQTVVGAFLIPLEIWNTLVRLERFYSRLEACGVRLAVQFIMETFHSVFTSFRFNRTSFPMGSTVPKQLIVNGGQRYLLYIPPWRDNSVISMDGCCLLKVFQKSGKLGFPLSKRDCSKQNPIEVVVVMMKCCPFSSFNLTARSTSLFPEEATNG